MSRPADGVDAQVDELLGRMTREEKVAQLGGVWVTALVSDDRFDPDAARRLMPHGIGHVTRIGASTGLRPAESAQLMNEIQRFAVEETRLGIPVVVHEESTGGYCARDATVFPQAIGLAATWDPALVEEVAAVIREQMVAVGARHTLAPVLDIGRDPRWGRVEETYGEDPHLAGALGTAYVRGVQGDLRRGVIATGKHFVGYGLPEGGMNHAPVHLGPRELREVFAEPFAAAIRDAGLASVMNSYSSVDGLPCAGSPEILDGLLRGELGFDGVVVADYFSVALLISHHKVAADQGEAAAVALRAGLDLELPATDCYGPPLLALLDTGDVDEALVDRAAGRVLATKVRLGLFEEPYVDAGAAAAVFQTPAQRALARRAAARSVVVLTNDGVLPIDAATERIAVLGPAADDIRLLQGDYHYPAHAEIVFEGGGALLPQAGGAFSPGPYFVPHVTPLEGIRAAAPGASVVHERGCDVSGADTSGIADAVAAAEDADIAIVCVGGRSGLQPRCTVGEARDAVDLRVTGPQPELVERVVATGTPTVVVVISGRVHALPDEAARAAALVVAWLPGEEGGSGLADVLLGAVDATGRLPVSLPRSVGQVPVHHDFRSGGGRAQFHGDYTDSPTTPLFPFGHGLSYTTFGYGDLAVEAATTRDTVHVEVEVYNTGARRGEELIQLYVTDEVASVARPLRRLIGFARAVLEPGGRCRVRFDVHPSKLAFYDPSMRFVTEPGAFTFAAGSSAGAIRARRTVTLEGGVEEYRQREIVATTAEVR